MLLHSRSFSLDIPYLDFSHIQRIANWEIRDFCPDGTPPVPIREIIKNKHNLKIQLSDMSFFKDSSLEERPLGFNDFFKGIIYLREDLAEPDQSGRRRFTLAHELAHFILHAEYFQGLSYEHFLELYISNHPRLERQANLLAGALLIPTRYLYVDLSNTKKDPAYQGFIYHEEALELFEEQVSKRYKVSREAVRVRFKELNTILTF